MPIVLLLPAHPDANAVVVRRFSNTLRDSVYEQVQWAIAELGLGRWFRARVSPMELTYLPTGQRIVFRGADDPLKLKGTKFGHGYAAVVWFEELDQFDGIDAVRSILNSLRRGGDDFWIFYTYNPPRTLWSWVNREEIEREKRADTLVRRSSYLDVIDTHPEWLGAPFIEEAEYLREADERAWRSEYLGEVTGTGGSVFGNVTGARLTDAQCRGFSRTRNGIDWGWFPDPRRFVRCGWVPGERRLFLFQELSANRKTPQETGAMVADALTFSDDVGKDAYQHDELIWCDDTPDGKQSMAVYRRELGLGVRPARKSNMRRLSYEWLAGLSEIVIDPVRGPLAYEIMVPKISVTGLGDYTRNVGYKTGSITFDYETKTFNYDRGIKLLADVMDVEEAGVLDCFVQAGAELQRTQVAPEADAFTYAQIAGHTGVTVDEADLSAAEAVDVLKALRDVTNAMDEAQVDTGSRYLFITPTLKGVLDDYSLANPNRSNRVLTRFSRIVEVPQVRFYTKISLNSGESDQFGYSKASDGRAINFMVVEKSAVVKFDKHVASRVFSPDELENLDSYMIKYRKYGIVELLDNKLSGVAVSAAPAA